MYFELHVSTVIIVCLLCMAIGGWINGGGNGPDCF